MSNIDVVQQYGRIRRIVNRYCLAVKTQINRIGDGSFETEEGIPWLDLQHRAEVQKNDWEALIIFLSRLRRCLVFIKELEPDLKLGRNYISEFDNTVPDLTKLRNFEEHFDDYSIGKGRNKLAEWGHLESFYIGNDIFRNGVGELSTNAAIQAAKLVRVAVLSLERNARALGYLTWEDRYGPKGLYRRPA